MFIVKYYHRDRFLGEEKFIDLEKAEDSIYESIYTTKGDYLEILDTSTEKINQEFVIQNVEFLHTETSEDSSLQDYENQDWSYLRGDDF